MDNIMRADDHLNTLILKAEADLSIHFAAVFTPPVLSVILAMGLWLGAHCNAASC